MKMDPFDGFKIDKLPITCSIPHFIRKRLLQLTKKALIVEESKFWTRQMLNVHVDDSSPLPVSHLPG